MALGQKYFQEAPRAKKIDDGVFVGQFFCGLVDQNQICG